MKIAFLARKSLPIHARSLLERPLGGTETGVIRLAEVLQSRGHEVFVFTAHNAPGAPIAGTPTYLPYTQIQSVAGIEALVTVQEWWPVMYGIKARKKFFWTGDGPEQHINFGMGDKRVVAQLDGLLAVSAWQANALCEASLFPRDKTFIIGNGVHLPDFSGAEPRQRKRLIYTSAPYRGLRLIPPIYEELKKSHAELELHVFSGMNIYDRDKPYQGPHQAEFQRLVPILKKLPGVFVHGNVRQGELARELMMSSVFIYPNTVFETCCISALEAQAAGCPPVVSENSALPETVGDAGFLIPGQPGSPEYNQRFIDGVDSLLSDNSLWGKLSARGKARIAQDYTWTRVAERFEALL